MQTTAAVAVERMSSLNVVPIQSEPAVQASCPNCGAPVAADQHYCLSCGRPCAPLRLPFLEVIQSSGQGSAGLPGAASNGYLPPLPPSGAAGPLQRYTGLFALIGVLLLTAVVGLLIGHWASGSGGSGSSGPQVVKLEGLSGATTAPSTSTAATTTSSSTESASGAAESKGSEHVSKQEEKEAAAPAKLAKAKKLSSSSLQKLSKLHGKQYEQEFNKVASGTAPIETGG
jgi:hypothetical protein